MPVNVFGRRSEVSDVAYRLVGALDDATIELGVGSARVAGALSGSTDRVSVTVTTEHLRGEDGVRQRAGMTGWLTRPVLVGSGRASALALVDDLHLSVSFSLDEDAGQDAVDAVVELAVRCAAWTDGMAVAIASDVVLGPDGSVWLEPGDVPAAPAPSAPDDVDPAALADPLVRDAREVLGSEGVPVGGVVLEAEFADDGPPADPPDRERVGRRLVVLAAVAARSLTEFDGNDLEEARTGLLDWVEGTGAAAELDRWEATLLAAPAGGIELQDRTDGAWRTEAAVVLAWALGLASLPPPDRIADPADVFEAVGLAADDVTSEILAGATLRSPSTLETLRRQLLTVHWRLREFGLRPGAMDLASVVVEHSWGPLTVEGIPLRNGDLEIGGAALVDADGEDVRTAMSIALERHRAVNWLVEGGPYADIDTST